MHEKIYDFIAFIASKCQDKTRADNREGYRNDDPCYDGLQPVQHRRDLGDALKREPLPIVERGGDDPNGGVPTGGAPVPGDQRPAAVTEEIEAVSAVGGAHPGRALPPER